MNKRELIDQLARRREALGLSSASLAERSGLTERSIRNALGHQGNPQLSSLLALVDRVLVLERGRLLADGPREAVLAALREGRLYGG